MSVRKRLFAAAAAGLMLCSTFAASVSAKESYDPYSYDRWGDAVASQAGYAADVFIDGKEIDGLYSKVEAMDGFDYDEAEWKQLLQLKEPADLFVDRDNKLLYIADKGNNRILSVKIDDFSLVGYLDKFSYNGEVLTLAKPEGIFVDQYTGKLYICDTENSRVLRSDVNGNVDWIYEKPTSEIYSQDLTYNPKKVCVDKAGNVYVVVKSITKGAVMYDFTGEFKGFFGANRVEATGEIIMNAFWNTIATEEQRARSTKSTAIGFSNFDIDDMGFIFTVTESSEVRTDAVKKVNPEGTNILSTLNSEELSFGDNSPAYYSIYTKQSALVDIDVGPNGEINILDFNHGRVFQYDEKGNLMFILGGDGDQLGLFRSACALETFENKIYVLDSRKNGLTVFTRTAFGEIVTNATNLYNKGYYDESEEPWRTVIKYDGNYRRAYIGIGNALLNQEKYEEAMKYFKISISRQRYNRAFEGWRDEILKVWLTPCVIALIVIAVVVKIVKVLNSKGIITFPWQRKRGA